MSTPSNGPTIAQGLTDARQTLQATVADIMRNAMTQALQKADWMNLAHQVLDTASDISDGESLLQAIKTTLSEAEWDLQNP